MRIHHDKVLQHPFLKYKLILFEKNSFDLFTKSSVHEKMNNEDRLLKLQRIISLLLQNKIENAKNENEIFEFFIVS